MATPATNVDGSVQTNASGSGTQAPFVVPGVGTFIPTPGGTVPAGNVVPTPHVEKPEKFNGVATTFKRWQQKMLFFLTTLNYSKYLKELPPQAPEEGEIDAMTTNAIDAWNHGDYCCRNYILNAMSDPLYNVYSKFKTSKELWESMDRKYQSEDAGSKKFIVGRFLDYKMVDSKSVSSQMEEFQVILGDIQAEGMNLSETFQVAAAIEKLPPSWNDYKNYLKHKRKEITLEHLVMRLQIEETNRAKQAAASNGARVNVMEHGKSQSYKSKANTPNKGKGKLAVTNGGVSKQKTKFKGKCFNCGRTGHKSSECRAPKKEANMVSQLTKEVEDLNLVAVISEVNMAESNPKEWWIDSGATRHVCTNRSMFSSFDQVQGEKIYMGNSASAKVEGKGTVQLKMTSGKILTLKDVLYVPEVRKNLMSAFLLNKHGFRIVIESDNVILTKLGVFVGKSYATDGFTTRKTKH